MRRSFTRPKALAALAAVGIIAAGCGGSSGSGAAGAAGTDGLGAQAAPASSIAFLDVNIDRGSSGWKQMLALGARFPSWPKLITQMNTSLNQVSSNGSSFNRDIEPWLGGEASIAVTGVTVGGASGGGSVQFVAYVQSTDDTQLEAALTRSGETVKGTPYSGFDTFTSKDGKTFAAVHGGALLVSNSEMTLHQAIDVRGGTGDQLANATSFKDAMAALPKDNSAVGYVDGAQLQTLTQLATSQASSSGVQAGGVSPQALDQFSSQLKGVRALAFAATPEDQGLRFRFAELLSKDAPATVTGVQEFTPTLESSASGDSYVYIGFQNLGPMLQTALTSLGTSQANLQQTFAQLQTQTGISFENDLVPLLSGEHAITVGPGLPVSAALLLKPADAAKGEATLRKVTAAIAKQGAATFTDANGGQTTQVSGLPVGWRRSGDLLAISNDPKAGDAVSSSLADDTSWKDFQKAIGVPTSVTGILYVNVGRLLGLAKTFTSNASASNQEALDNAAHVGRVVAWGAKNGDTLTADLFIEITK
ncbi:MAG: hypothetical protein QOH15_2051 [Gaiellales bacterium]|nr:hypothetical protein [Gaiellales bacterium]